MSEPWAVLYPPSAALIVVVIRVSSKVTDFWPPPPFSMTPQHDSTHPHDSLSLLQHSYRSYRSTIWPYGGASHSRDSLSVLRVRTRRLCCLAGRFRRIILATLALGSQIRTSDPVDRSILALILRACTRDHYEILSDLGSEIQDRCMSHIRRLFTNIWAIWFLKARQLLLISVSK